MSKVLERVERNVQQYLDTYPTAETLLYEAMQDASVWVVPLVTTKKAPSLMQMEKLATQLLAIVAASSPEK